MSRQLIDNFLTFVFITNGSANSIAFFKQTLCNVRRDKTGHTGDKNTVSHNYLILLGQDRL